MAEIPEGNQRLFDKNTLSKIAAVFVYLPKPVQYNFLGWEDKSQKGMGGGEWGWEGWEGLGGKGSKGMGENRGVGGGCVG